MWWGLSLASPRPRAALLASVVVLACAAEPYFLKTFWWFPFAKTAERPWQPSLASRILARHAPQENRVYTRVNLFPERQDRLDPQNLSMLHGLHNVAGYEPFMLARYGRALGGVGVDSVNPRPGLPRDETLLAPQSHVLDLLNTTFLVTFDDLSRTPPDVRRPAVGREGIGFDAANFEFEIKPGAQTALGAFGAEGDTLALVSVLANSAAAEQGTPVARARVHTPDGRVVERDLRAGIDTAEWSHERADVRPAVRHALAPAFDSVRAPGDDFVTHRYLARVPLGERLRAARVEVANLTRNSSLVLYKATLHDSASGRSRPLRNDPELLAIDQTRWRTEHGGDGLLILRNTRALPRAWLVAEAESVDGEEALRRIRGEPGARAFDPRRTALVEASPAELPALPGGEIAPAASARVAYGHNRIDIETDSPTPAMLVVSETFYPGWEATVDGTPAKLFVTDYLLRGVHVPAGRHRVGMRYAAPAARHGALLSLATILLLAGLAFRTRRARNTDT
ncbi:MAG: YfhO family protein [Acidobacteria bacterium]|nr:YfhO family protein [Acidobacteriota bacterium]